MYNSEESLQRFVQLQKKKYANLYGINEENMVFHNIGKGSNSITATFSTNDGHTFCKHMKYNIDKDISIHPYFNYLELSPEDFD